MQVEKKDSNSTRQTIAASLGKKNLPFLFKVLFSRYPLNPASFGHLRKWRCQTQVIASCKIVYFLGEDPIQFSGSRRALIPFFLCEKAAYRFEGRRWSRLRGLGLRSGTQPWIVA